MAKTYFASVKFARRITRVGLPLNGTAAHGWLAALFWMFNDCFVTWQHWPDRWLRAVALHQDALAAAYRLGGDAALAKAYTELCGEVLL